MRMIAHIVSSAIIMLGPLLALAQSFDGDRPDQLMVSTARQVPETYDDACLLADFHLRIREYVELHRRLEGPLPPLKLSNDPREIRRAIDSLKKELQAARLKARQGDIFTSDITLWFRQTIEATFKSTDWVEVLAAFQEEEEENATRTASPRVNASYPESSPLVPMSIRLLLALPALPEELQYRFMNRALILWDVHAELIVDFIPDVIPLKMSPSVK
jgi:hypothetical protein